jgi:hypothetical protein
MTNGFDFRPTGDIVYHRQRGNQDPQEWWIYLPTIGEREAIDTLAAESRTKLLKMADDLAPADEANKALIEAQQAGDAKAVTAAKKRLEKALEDAEYSPADLQQAIRELPVEWFAKVVELCGAGWPAERGDWPSIVRSSELTKKITEHWNNTPLGVSGTV